MGENCIWLNFEQLCQAFGGFGQHSCWLEGFMSFRKFRKPGEPSPLKKSKIE